MSFIRRQQEKMSEFYSEKVQSKSNGGKERPHPICKSIIRRKFKVKAMGGRSNLIPFARNSSNGGKEQPHPIARVLLEESSK